MNKRKKQILVDTDIFLDHLTYKGEKSALIKLMEKYDCFTSVINAIELYNAVRSEDSKYVDMLLYSIKILGIHSRYALKIANKSKNRNLQDAFVVKIVAEKRIVLATFSATNYLNYIDLNLLKITKFRWNIDSRKSNRNSLGNPKR